MPDHSVSVPGMRHRGVRGLAGFGLAGLMLAAVILLGGARPAMAGDPSKDGPLYALSLGMFDAMQREDESIEFRAEYRHDSGNAWFSPFAGLMTNTQRALHGYVGIYVDWFVTDSFVVTPSFAPGFYLKGSSKDLGHIMEFRSQLEFAYRFDGGTRLGLSLNHISNAGIGSRNPGAESLVMTLAVPIGQWW